VIGRRRGSKEMHKETLMMNQGEHLKKKKFRKKLVIVSCQGFCTPFSKLWLKSQNNMVLFNQQGSW
jgi:hypothetical protein